MSEFTTDEEEKYYELTEDTINLFEAILAEKSIPFKIKTEFIGSVKLKKMIEIKKINDVYSHLLNGSSMLVIINEDLLSSMDDEAVSIQLEEAINGIEVNIDKGNIKVSKPKLSISPAMVRKHGIEKILRAHNLAEEIKSQNSDK